MLYKATVGVMSLCYTKLLSGNVLMLLQSYCRGNVLMLYKATVWVMSFIMLYKATVKVMSLCYTKLLSR